MQLPTRIYNNVRIGYSITTKIKFLFLKLIFIYKFQINLTLSVVTDAILVFFNHPVAQGFEIQKNETVICATNRSLC